ncbi:MAG: hypothetical protein V9E81_16660 [Marmoricola sp.]
MSSTTASSGMGGINKLLVTVGKSVGGVVGALYQSGRDAVDTVIRNILPFMAFISVLIGIILKTGFGNWLAHLITPLAGNPHRPARDQHLLRNSGALAGARPWCRYCAGGWHAAGSQLRQGRHRPQYALPALFAINPQVGCDFIPVGLALGEAEPETVEVGVPAVLISRLITGPFSVVIAWVASFGLYSSN